MKPIIKHVTGKKPKEPVYFSYSVLFLFPVVRRHKQFICKCYIDTTLVKNFNNVYKWFKFSSSTQNVSNEEALDNLFISFTSHSPHIFPKEHQQERNLIIGNNYLSGLIIQQLSFPITYQ